MKKTPYYTAVLLLSCCLPLWASDRLVHQWTDSNGQIHYGDARAAFGKNNAQPVKITQPISTVHNDHPIRAQPTQKERQSTATQRRRSTKARSTTQNQKWSTDQCEALRMKIDQNRQIRPQRRLWENDYDQYCIHGHYYGNSK